ncbi:hypothetical protein CYMTET_21156 [Cymbomonas tetramitiformis]|uniref:MAM domain-containing protein n=1 Tax=Cymbomonas tetramitiformis TaxID=36881 RepID=A0AAE0L392_9CHLO|nr:hypothetical protein CYMTET_21156 [Cymbomonas tetramitiformis]
MEAFTVGYNYNGQLGDGSRSDRNSPVRVMSGHDVIQAAAGYRHTVFVTAGGEAYGTGHNSYGQLGDGTSSQRNSPVRVMSGHDVAQAAAGHYHTVFVTAGGEAYGTGVNDYGQLGDGSRSYRYSPVSVMSGHNVIQAAAGYYHTVFVTAGGEAYGTGYNFYGQLGDGTLSQRNSPPRRLLPRIHSRDANAIRRLCYESPPPQPAPTGRAALHAPPAPLSQPPTEMVNISVVTPYIEDFEAGFGGLRSVSPRGSGATWTIHSSATPSVSTGPSSGWSDRSTHYAYIEASNEGSTPHQEASLESPQLQLAGDVVPQLVLRYHMHGEHMGSLHVDLFNGSGWVVVWSASGTQGDSWRTAHIALQDTDTVALQPGVGGGEATTLQYRVVSPFRLSATSGPAPPAPPPPPLTTLTPPPPPPPLAPLAAVHGNYFGSGVHGDARYVAAHAFGSEVDGPMVVRQYKSLVIEAGATVTTAARCKGLLVLVQGDCTIDGALSMTARGARVDPTAEGVPDSGLRFAMLQAGGTGTLPAAEWQGAGDAAQEAMSHMPEVVEAGVVISIARAGAEAGANGSLTLGQSGGGGAGGAASLNCCGGVGGSGAGGTCFSGGAGGGGSDGAYHGGHGSANGGEGGSPGAASQWYSRVGSGMGNPLSAESSTEGTGGLLVLLVGGRLRLGAEGEVTAEGGAGGGDGATAAGGGGSGGGVVVVLHGETLHNAGRISAGGGSGGVATEAPGQSGGGGSVQVVLVDPPLPHVTYVAHWGNVSGSVWGASGPTDESDFLQQYLRTTAAAAGVEDAAVRVISCVTPQDGFGGTSRSPERRRRLAGYDNDEPWAGIEVETFVQTASSAQAEQFAHMLQTPDVIYGDHGAGAEHGETPVRRRLLANQYNPEWVYGVPAVTDVGPMAVASPPPPSASSSPTSSDPVDALSSPPPNVPLLTAAPTPVECDLTRCATDAGLRCGYCLEPVNAADCPADLGPDFVHCGDPGLGDGDLCEGDGECGTSTTLDNCGDGFEVYRKRCLAVGAYLTYATGHDGNGRLANGFGYGSTSTPARIMSWSDTSHLSAGSSHSLFVTAEGQGFAAGMEGCFLQSGGDQNNVAHSAIPVMQGYTLSCVAAGGSCFSLFLTSQGQVFGAGYNYHGQLGSGNAYSSTYQTVTLMNDVSNVVAISAGDRHSLMLTGTNEAYATGDNNYGQLGDGSRSNRFSPVRVLREHSVGYVSAGHYHSLFVTTAGSTFTTGYNYDGQLGDGTRTVRYEPVRVMSEHSVAQVSGSRHSLFLTTAGQVFACGPNYYGQLGDGTTTTRVSPVAVMSGYVVTQMSAGREYSMFVTSAGVAYACGLNSDGQLGDGSWTNRYTPVEVMGSTYRVRQVSAGLYHSLFTGDPWVPPPSPYFPPAPPSLAPTTLPPPAPSPSNPAPLPSPLPPFTSASPTTSPSTAPPTPLTAAPTRMECDVTMCSRDSVGVSCGYCLEPVDAADCPADLGPDFVHCGDPGLGDGDLCEGDGECGTSTTLDNCAGRLDVYQKICNAVVAELAYATGSDSNGRLGDGVDRSDTATPVRIMSTVALADVAAGNEYSLFVGADGQAYGAGDNGYGCLGDGQTWAIEYIPVPVLQGHSVSRVAASTAIRGCFSLFLTAEGRVYGAGQNSYGQLGTGNSSDSYDATLIGLSNVTAISAGDEHSLFITAGLEAYATGRNHLGQLGDGTETTRYSPVRVMRNHSVTHVSAGGSHSLFVTVEGAAYSSGLNDHGQLGDGGETPRYEPVRVMSEHSVAQVSGGHRHSLFLTTAGQAFTCGQNSYGQLGDGSTTTRVSPVAVMSGYVVTQMSAGWEHSMFVTSAGVAYACGVNGNGQLGDGSRTDRYTPVEVMGSTYRVRQVSAGSYHSLLAGVPFGSTTPAPTLESTEAPSQTPSPSSQATAPPTEMPTSSCAVNATLLPHESTFTDTAMDDDDAGIATGYFAAHATFGAHVFQSWGGTDIFITKTDANGTLSWAIQAGGTSDDYASSVSAGRSGSIFVVGSFSSSSATFGTHVLTNTGEPGHFDMFSAKVNGLGTFMWVRQHSSG